MNEIAMDHIDKINEDDVPGIIESLLFVSGEPLTISDLAGAIGVDKRIVERAANALALAYRERRSGLRLAIFGDKLQLATLPENSKYVDKLYAPSGRQTLSQSAIETLSIIAYRQPITRMEIEQIRGVRCEYAVNSLQQKGLIREVGRKDALGRPILYGTTEIFLRNFALGSLDELPNRDELVASRDMEI